MRKRFARAIRLACSVGVSVCLVFAASAAQGPSTTGHTSTPGGGTNYTLDFILESPISIAVMTDGTVRALVPDVDPHSYLSLRGKDDCGLIPTTASPNYAVSAPASGTPTNFGSSLSPGLTIDGSKISQLQLDPANLRYMSLTLPQPSEIDAVHLDPATITPPGSTGASSYQTAEALRYSYPSPPLAPITVSVAGSATLVCQALTPLSLGNERIIRATVGPAAEDDVAHTHARRAFKAMVAMFPPISLTVSYPFELAMSSHAAAARNSPSPVAATVHATDCLAPVIVVRNVPMPGW
jgi:hypothetical protein